MSEEQVERGDRLTLTLVSWGRLGEAMACHNGSDVFVFGGIPGERVVAEVLRVRRKYIAARVVDLLETSPDRVEPPCAYFGNCTGCQWQHVAYDAQLEAKGNQVQDALRRVGGFSDANVLPVVPSPGQLGYRNHARFTIGEEGALGFVHRETRRFVKIDHCMLMHQGINDLLSQLQGHCAETTQLSIRAGETTGDYLIQPTMRSPAITVATGQKHYLDSIDGRSFRVASPSFFQVNSRQASRLAQSLREALQLQGTEVLLDAYAGVGTFAILLAPYVSKVIAIEESAAAVADAKENAAGLDNVEFVLGKTEEVLGSLPHKPDVVVMDPPRAGCQKEAIQGLLQLAPDRVVYVSCDPETLARDLKAICQGQYILDRVEPLDMFPQTHHVESLAVLHRTTPGPTIILASASPRRRELLTELGLEFQVRPSEVEEVVIPGESAQAMVQRLSRAKALEVAEQLQEGYVIGADSTVVLDGRPIGKPADAADARRMLRELSGTRHHVTTGLTVVDVASGRRLTDALTGAISMRELSTEEIEASVASGTPMDKAGAYAVQDRELRPAELVDGCYTNVVGLPLCRVIEMLAELGCDLALKQPAPQQWPCRCECPLQRSTPA